MRKLIQREIRSWFSPPLKPVEMKSLCGFPGQAVCGLWKVTQEITEKLKSNTFLLVQHKNNGPLPRAWILCISLMRFRNISINSDFPSLHFHVLGSSWASLKSCCSVLLRPFWGTQLSWGHWRRHNLIIQPCYFRGCSLQGPYPKCSIFFGFEAPWDVFQAPSPWQYFKQLLFVFSWVACVAGNLLIPRVQINASSAILITPQHR